MTRARAAAVGCALVLGAGPSWAADAADDASGEDVTVSGVRPEQVPGSAHVVKDAQLRRFKYDDPHQVLTQVPGVYVRGEDGMGLRPNIGIRGASSDRSKKLTLMEDGVLFGPAPYSAPAAYYFRNLLDDTYIVGRRPFGARPGSPRWVQAGVRLELD